MPVITIETWPMKEEKKPELIKDLTDAFIKIGVPAQAVTIIIHETELNNWGSAGEQHSTKFKDLPRE